MMTAATVALGMLATPASAAVGHGTSGTYLALGDSLAFGYQPTHVTGQGYVDQLYASLRVHDPRLTLTNLGCPGETSGSMLSGGKCRYPGGASQLDTAVAFLRGHHGRVSLITLDIGANDVDGCASASGLDLACVVRGLAGLAVDATRIVARLRQAEPFARIVAMTYYDPFLAAYLTGPSGQALARESLTVSGVFNGLLTGVYRAAGFRIADVAGAFSTTDMSTLTGGVPLDVARICSWTWMCAPAPLGPDIHANQQGYGVIARAFLAAL